MKNINLVCIKFLIFFLPAFALLPGLAKAQELVLDGPTTGEHSSNTRIKILPGFRTVGSFRGFITGSLTVPLSSAPSASLNYVRTRTIKKAGVTSADQLGSPLVSEVTEGIQYFDGLGRPLQTVQTKGSPLGNDIVQPVVYDGIGREAVKYLPYTEQSGGGSYREGAISTQGQFYGTSGWDATVAKTTAPFSQTVFESSALNRVLEQGAPGTVWQPAAGHRDNTTGRTIMLVNGINNGSTSYTTDGYAVRLWLATPIAAEPYKMTLSSSGYYGAGELSLKITKDENWLPADGKAGTNEEYTDKEGHVVLKRLFNIKSGNMETLSTYYVYDDMGNLAFVLPPGVNPDAGAVDGTAQNLFCYQYRYDGRKRLIEKKVPGKGWEFMVYNKLDQMVLSQDAVLHGKGQWMFSKYDALGRVVITGLYNSAGERPALETTVAAQTSLFEIRSSDEAGYSSNAFPQSIAYYHSIQYYDDYSFPGASSYPYAGSLKTRGLLTGSRITVLNTGDMLLSVNYYDEEGRVARVYKQHYQSGAVNAGNYDELSNTYNFEGVLTASTRVHHNESSGSTTIANRYEYDHVGRKLRSYEKINGDSEMLLAENNYNEIGQLKSKGLGNGLQHTSYAYNERGWLKGSTSDQFSLQLQYQDGSTPQFNGNISGQLWGAGASTANSFVYSYDKLNRLGTGVGPGMTESLSYDVMGNIESLTRDQLTRAYVYNGNQLTRTTGGPETGTYGYDLNGNATTDGRSGKTFTYNDLNLPATVTGGLSYVYDATGDKLKKNSSGTVTDYIDGIQYTNRTIELIQTEVGVARRNGASYSYEYNLSDHLGNVRYTFQKSPVSGQLERLQSDDYYPFGLRKSGNPVSLNNKYLYNGKELQEELGQYDYGARFYDPVIGRWNVVDPLVELNQENTSPYIYVLNNPILLTDPDGRYPDDPPLKKLDLKKNPNGDQIGIIKNATVEQKRQNPVNAFIADLAHDILDGLGVNAIDNAVYSEGKLSGSQKIVLAATILQSIPVGEGKAGKVTAYEVGSYSELKAGSVKGDGLDIHHAPQKQQAGQLIEGYNVNDAPSIAVPRSEHIQIPTRRGTNTGNARGQLAKDILDLRNHTNAPVESLQQLIEFNKKMYPELTKQK